MYGQFTVQNKESPESVIIMDMVHGGDIIAERLLGLGYKVTCADVYNIASQILKDNLISKGATVSVQVPRADYDLLISPAHCPDEFMGGSTYKERMTFNGAVNRLVSGNVPFRIEVTGVKGKTSTCYLIAHILDSCGKKVYLHTSRGDGPYSNGAHSIECLKSIAPTSILTLPQEGYDIIVSEVSLGGSAKAEISVITNLVEDYGIAKDTRKASVAKAEVLNDDCNFVLEEEEEIWSKYGKKLCLHKDSIAIVDKPKLGQPLTIRFDYKGKEHTVTLRDDYLSLQYVKAIDMALSVCSKLDIDGSSIVSALKSFRGVPGRGEISFADGVWHINERNPGISHISVKRTLECLKEMDALGNAFVIVDPVSKKVCDKMRPQQIKEVIDGFGLESVFTDGINNDVEIPSDKKTVIRFVKEGYQ